jgi:rubredoxin
MSEMVCELCGCGMVRCADGWVCPECGFKVEDE